jgi:hypothetical protein
MTPVIFYWTWRSLRRDRHSRAARAALPAAPGA